METTERNKYDMLIRVDGFGKENISDFPTNSAGNINFLKIADVIGKLREHAAAQTSNLLGNTTARKSGLREDIREQMKKIARTARALAIDNDGLHKLFRVPDGSNDAQLIAAAREFADEAERFKTDFIGYNLPADFIEDLEADITGFENLLSEKARATGEKVSATASIDDELELGMNAARRLDAIVRNVYADNAGKLAAWTTARHIQKSPKPAAPPAPVG